jgi:hypothetical protein
MPAAKRHQTPIAWAELCVGLVTPPVVVAAIVAPLLGRSLQQIGRFSEDLLRGERLPVLHFPDRVDTEP